MLEQIKELRKLRSSTKDATEKQAYTDAIVQLTKKLAGGANVVSVVAGSASPPAESKTPSLPEKELSIKEMSTLGIQKGNFKFEETEMPKRQMSQLESTVRYIPQ